MARRRFFAAGLISSSKKSIQSGLKKRGLSNRALIVGIVLFVVAITLAPPIQHYFTQRAQISALKSQVVTDRAALDAARAELELWKDPDYVKSQARERLHFVMPGERQYIVTGEDGINSDAPVENDVVSNLPEGQPWYTRMIASITEAGKQ